MGPAGPGVLSAAVGVGGLLGAAAAMTLIGRPAPRARVPARGRRGRRPDRARRARDRVRRTAFSCSGVAGIGKSFFDVTARTLLQRTVDDDVLARVFGVQEGLVDGGARGRVGDRADPRRDDRRGRDVRPRGALAPGRRLLVVRIGSASVDHDARLADPADVALLRGTPIFEPLGPASIERVAQEPRPDRRGSGHGRDPRGRPGRPLLRDRGGARSRCRATVSRSRGWDPATSSARSRCSATCLGPPRSPRRAFASLRSLDRAQFLAAVTGLARGCGGARRGDGPSHRRARRLTHHRNIAGANPSAGVSRKTGWSPSLRS